MSRPPFRMVPLIFIDACSTGEMNERQFFLGCFILRYASYKTGELSLTLGELRQRSGYKLSPDSLLNDLKALRRQAWIDFESKQGQRTPYKFRTTGLAPERAEQPLPNDFRNELPDSSEVEPPPSGVHSEVEPPARKTLGSSEQLPKAEVRAEVPPSTTSTTSSEEAHAEGSTTSEPEPPLPSEPEFLPPLDALEPNPFHENGSLLGEEEIAQLGIASLKELHRRHERGEF